MMLSIQLVVVCNKIDAENSTVNTEQVLAQLGEENSHNIEVYDVSCKNGKGIEAVRASIDRMIQRHKN